jgi:hypothetical protein
VKLDEEKHVRRDCMDWVSKDAEAVAAADTAPPPVKVESKDSDPVRSLFLKDLMYLLRGPCVNVTLPH